MTPTQPLRIRYKDSPLVREAQYARARNLGILMCIILALGLVVLWAQVTGRLG